MNEKVKEFYNSNSEFEISRLDEPYKQLEFRNTLYLMNKYFPSTGKVCDIGCGVGKYSLELLKKDYNLTLYDLSQTMLDVAADKIDLLGYEADNYICGDAQQLKGLPDDSFDAALLMGPMYHILDKPGRLEALEEFRRILKPGGVGIIAYLNSWGVIKACIDEIPMLYCDKKNIDDMLDEAVVEIDDDDGFTDAYFTTPPIAKDEITSSGFNIISYAGVESFVSGMITGMKKMCFQFPEAFDNVLEAAEETCELERYRDTTEHIHFVVQKR